MTCSDDDKWSAARCIRWDELGVGENAYHAAFVAGKTLPGSQVVPHWHDFFELFLVISGEGEHSILPYGGTLRMERLARGDLIFLRPSDRHSLAVVPGHRLHWINIAFPASAWAAFRAAAGLDEREWDAAPLPRGVQLPDGETQAACAALFHGLLQRFQSRRMAGWPAGGDRLSLCAFLAAATQPLLSEPGERDDRSLIKGGPPWLERACAALQRELDAGSEGPPVDSRRFAELAGVSMSHLARTLQAQAGLTPTEYITERRLTQAAILLTTTPDSIVDISCRCGFGQLSYFYRLFGRRFGMPPNAYRQAAQSPVTP